MIVGLDGALEAGKDSTAEIMHRKYGFEIVALADNLKQMCMHTFGLTYDDCYTTKGKQKKFEIPLYLNATHCENLKTWIYRKNKWPKQIRHVTDINTLLLSGNKIFLSSREVLQFVGTEFCRSIFDPDFHVVVLFNQIKRNSWGDVVITDARFPNERNQVKALKGLNFFIDCKQTPKSEGIEGHVSENSHWNLDEYDHVIPNDKEKGMDYLKGNVIKTMKKFSIAPW